MRDIARALAYLHAQTPPVIHGDIRAQNILIKSDGHIYVCDFGLTKYENTVTTASVQGAGAIEWLSPERLDFFRPDDPDGSSRSKEDDVYAFGITIAEARPRKISCVSVLNAVNRSSLKTTPIRNTEDGVKTLLSGLLYEIYALQEDPPPVESGTSQPSAG